MNEHVKSESRPELSNFSVQCKECEQRTWFHRIDEVQTCCSCGNTLKIGEKMKKFLRARLEKQTWRTVSKDPSPTESL
jgi:ribosomal protein S27E